MDMLIKRKYLLPGSLSGGWPVILEQCLRCRYFGHYGQANFFIAGELVARADSRPEALQVAEILRPALGEEGHQTLLEKIQQIDYLPAQAPPLPSLQAAVLALR